MIRVRDEKNSIFGFYCSFNVMILMLLKPKLIENCSDLTIRSLDWCVIQNAVDVISFVPNRILISLVNGLSYI